MGGNEPQEQLSARVLSIILRNKSGCSLVSSQKPALKYTINPHSLQDIPSGTERNGTVRLQEKDVEDAAQAAEDMSKKVAKGAKGLKVAGKPGKAAGKKKKKGDDSDDSGDEFTGEKSEQGFLGLRERDVVGCSSVFSAALLLLGCSFRRLRSFLLERIASRLGMLAFLKGREICPLRNPNAAKLLLPSL